MQQLGPEFDELQLWDLDRLLTDRARGNCWTCTPGRRTPYQWTATGESHWSAGLDQGKRPLSHDSVVDDLNMHNNGHVKNQSNVHRSALCVPVSVAYRQYPPHCRRTGERHHPQIGKDCWNLSRMFTETTTGSTQARTLSTPYQHQGTDQNAPDRDDRTLPVSTCTKRPSRDLTQASRVPGGMLHTAVSSCRCQKYRSSSVMICTQRSSRGTAPS